MKNWKTNLFGIAILLIAVLLFKMERPVEASACILTACGFFNTKDNTTTGVGKDSMTESEIEKLRQRNKI